MHEKTIFAIIETFLQSCNKYSQQNISAYFDRLFSSIKINIKHRLYN